MRNIHFETDSTLKYLFLPVPRAMSNNPISENSTGGNPKGVTAASVFKRCPNT